MATQHSPDANVYFVPTHSKWPFIGSIAMMVTMVGVASWLNDAGWGKWTFYAGIAMLVLTLFWWFSDVVRESQAGHYNHQVDGSFRMGMVWFIFSEVMFFAIFFGALFYARVLSVPWLSEGDTMNMLWPGYAGGWPTSGPGGKPFETIGAWGIPAINTLILLSSGVTLTWAHWGLLKNKRSQLVLGLFLTVALGITFIALQALEYHHAYTELGLTLGAGIYGATFFMLTGFHGFHVTLGTLMLIVILLRSIKGHFTPESHFGFEGVAWYWHFVDVVWLLLFIFVYAL